MNMSNLMVHHGKRARRIKIGIKHARGFPGVEKAGLPQNAVGENCPVAGDNRLNRVIAGNQPLAALRFGGGDEQLQLAHEFS